MAVPSITDNCNMEIFPCHNANLIIAEMMVTGDRHSSGGTNGNDVYYFIFRIVKDTPFILYYFDIYYNRIDLLVSTIMVFNNTRPLCDNTAESYTSDAIMSW